MGKLLVGMGLMALMLCRPEAAANGAREAMCQWYYVVAPSLFPFMALMPLLTCREAGEIYETALGPVMRRLFGLPGSAASPMVVGMLAGSPAGCAAARAVAAEQGYTRGQLERVALACCGMSPAFFISAVGSGMLGDVTIGHVLLRTQLLTQMVMLALTRLFCRDAERLEISDNGRPGGAVLSIINVAGYMTLFGAVGGALQCPGVQMALDITAGSRMICASDLEIWWKLPALSALSGFGGLCICFQNIGALQDCGISPVKFVLIRCLASVLSACITAVQMHIEIVKIPAIELHLLSISCIFVLILVFPVVFKLKRTIF